MPGKYKPQKGRSGRRSPYSQNPPSLPAKPDPTNARVTNSRPSKKKQ